MDTQNAEDTVDVDVIGDDDDDITTILTRLELNLARFSEKVANLSNFVMHLETLMGECEGFYLDEEKNVDMDCVMKVMEFDLLFGVLGSEIKELDLFLDTLHADIDVASQKVSSSNPWHGRLLESVESLMQSEESFSDIKEHSLGYHKTLSSYKREVNEGIVEERGILIDMKTVEHRNVLKMLNKSLASEMDLEKSFNDSRKIEEKLKSKIVSLEKQVVLMEEEATDVWERWFEADNAREVLKGITNELSARLKMSQFNLNGFRQRESELKAKLETSIEKWNNRDISSDNIESSTAEDKLVHANSEAASLSDKVHSLEKLLKETECQLLNVRASADEYQKQYNVLRSENRDMDNIIIELKENVSNAESRANAAEAQCKWLTETNDELNKELALLKDGTSETVELLEKQLKESDLRLQYAVASAEACQEKQKMLYSTVEDMEHVIKDLKSKVSRAENRADDAEDKCIILSESNADLNEEVSFLRSRLECLEGSLHQVEEAKMASAKDIGRQTKLFKNLVTQLAFERERLNKQLSSLASENKILVVKLKQTSKDPSQKVSVTLVPDHEVNRKWTNLSEADNEVQSNPVPEVGSVRRIDAGALSFKHLFIAMFVLLLSAMTYLYFKEMDGSL